MNRKVFTALILIFSTTSAIAYFLPWPGWRIAIGVISAICSTVVILRDKYKCTPSRKFLYDIFLICSIRDASMEELDKAKQVVAGLENDGAKVYWPYRDTPQNNDPIGDRICADNRRAISLSKTVCVLWSPNSKGSHYDLGVAQALNKIIIPLNTHEFDKTPGKSFNNILHKIDDQLHSED